MKQDPSHDDKLQGGRSGENRPRMGVFQARWPLQSHTLNLAKAMVHQGFAVDLYLFRVDTAFVDLESAMGEGLSLHVYDESSERQGSEGRAGRPSVSDTVLPPPAKWAWIPPRLLPAGRSLMRAWRRVRDQAREIGREGRETALLHSLPCRDLLPALVLDWTRRVTASPHAVLVGVEPLGLIWAAEVARSTGIPYAYYSLELYTRDHPASRSVRARRVKLCEARCHRAAAATIIQDEARARVLLEDNGLLSDDKGVEAFNVLYLPVSVPGPARRSRSTFLHDRLGLAHDVDIVLQLGGIAETRLSLSLATAVQSLPQGCRLVMHGRGAPETLQAVMAADPGDRVSISTDLVGESLLPMLAASASVGLVLYAPSFLNDRLTAKSSEKLALFLRAGVPIVTFGYPGYEVIRDYGCGVLIDTLDELPGAVGTILADRDAYSENAIRCFDEQYDYSRLVPPVAAALGRLTMAKGLQPSRNSRIETSR